MGPSGLRRGKVNGKRIERYTTSEHGCSAVSASVTPWTVAHQAPLSLGFSRQEYWSGLPFPPPGDLPDPGIEAKSPMSPALTGGFFTTEPPGKSEDLDAHHQNSSGCSWPRCGHPSSPHG